MTSDLETWNPDIAIIGMAARFPGAANLDQFWSALVNELDCVTLLSEQDLRSSGIEQSAIEDPNYVRCKGIVDNSDAFDHTLFNFSPSEATATDPQQRVFLECAYEAFEHAGYGAGRPMATGVFAGCAISTYLPLALSDTSLVRAVGRLRILLGNDKDHLATMVSYRLDLRGPSVTVQTACSTSLVAVHMARESLLRYESDMALAGGISLSFPSKTGYHYEKGGISSIDGRCRSFDADATGSLPADGAAAIVLKRLDEAIRDGDTIWGIIKGSAVNNDGGNKMGYFAPSVEGQAGAIRSAYLTAGVEPNEVCFIEGHGSATQLGDPIEIAALAKVFNPANVSHSIALGSVKSNIGHAGPAAGVAGLIKAVLALRKRTLPSTKHFTRSNPLSLLETSVFEVNSVPRILDGPQPLRAGVSSFGMGGTNAHVVLEAPPESLVRPQEEGWYLLPVSAKTESALTANVEALRSFLLRGSGTPLHDVAHTLQVGRERYPWRHILLAASRPSDHERPVRLEADPSMRALSSDAPPEIVFLFPGIGEHRIDTARSLFESQPIFRDALEACSSIAKRVSGDDLVSYLYPSRRSGSDTETLTPDIASVGVPRLFRSDGDNQEDDRFIDEKFSHLMTFAIEYAMAQLWIDIGILPSHMVGYSVGEYVCAAVSGSLSLQDSLGLLLHRSRLLEEAVLGGMLFIPTSAQAVTPHLSDEVYVSGFTGFDSCVVSGSHAALTTLEARLRHNHILSERIRTTKAFHCPMMSHIGNLLNDYPSPRMQTPSIPYLSNVSGDWITEKELRDESYWGKHLCNPVKLLSGDDAFFHLPRLYIECGPGEMLSSLISHEIKHHARSKPITTASLPLSSTSNERHELLRSVGTVWLAGHEPVWRNLYRDQTTARRIPIPTYEMERTQFWPETQLSGIYPFLTRSAPLRETDASNNPITSANTSPAGNPEVDEPGPEEFSETEALVAEVWKSVLGIRTISPTDNFFQLGGNSLLGLRIITELRRLFELELAPHLILHTPTIAGLARIIEQLLIDELQSRPTGQSSPE